MGYMKLVVAVVVVMMVMMVMMMVVGKTWARARARTPARTAASDAAAATNRASSFSYGIVFLHLVRIRNKGTSSTPTTRCARLLRWRAFASIGFEKIQIMVWVMD